MATHSNVSPFPCLSAGKLVRSIGLLLLCLLGACSQRYAVSINNQTIIDQRPNAGSFRFDDPGLQGCVNFALQQPDATLETIAVLSCSGWDIENIEGIGALRALQFLDLSNNRINSLAPLAPLRRLSSISLTDNRVRDIDPLNALNSLTSAALTGNNNISCAQLEVLQSRLGDNLRRPTSCRE